MLDKKFIDEIKKDILFEKERLEKELSLIATKDGDDYKTNFPDIGDEDDDNELEVAEYDQAIDAKNKIVSLLNDANHALKQIENNTYGHCDNCNEEIDPGRLKAYPAAKTCIKCQNR